MDRYDLIYLEAHLLNELMKRRNLGGYSTDAESIYGLCQGLFRVVEHLVETYPEPQEIKRAVPKKDKSPRTKRLPRR